VFCYDSLSTRLATVGEKGQMKIKPNAAAKAKTCLFIKFILEPLWEVHNVILANNDKDRMTKMIQSLQVKVSARDSQAEPKVASCHRVGILMLIIL
jgi:hypothetical protein